MTVRRTVRVQVRMTDLMEPDVDLDALGFRPSSPSFIADPYPVFAALRDAGPVLAYPQRGVHLLTRFEHVHAALRDRRLGRAFTHRYTPEEFGQPAADDRWPRWSESERWSLLNLEPPDHTRLRRLVTAVFTPRAVAALRPVIEDLSQRTLRSALDQGPFDLIAEYAQPYSVGVICHLLGVPQADGPQLLAWSHAIVKMYELSTPVEQQRAAEQAAADFIDYVRDIIAVRRRAPADDLITELIGVADQGDRLTEDEIVCTVIVLLNAGHEATVNTLGNGMRALLRHPDQWRRIVDGEVEPTVAVEEMIRWDGPLQMFERWVLEDGVHIADREFRRGDRIGMLFGSANRDPDRFERPDEFDIGRGDSTHIGFGGGIHFCIGAPLARMEIAVSLAQLRAAAPALELCEVPDYQPSFVIRGLRSLVLQAQRPAAAAGVPVA
jgi:unspecific monooxygenase